MSRRESARRTWYSLLALAGLLLAAAANAERLSAERLGVIYNLDDPSSQEIAFYYAKRRLIPSDNLIGVHLPLVAVITPESFAPVRAALLNQLPTSVQSLLLAWSKPWAVGCMSITTALAAGYRPEFCVPGCGKTAPNPLFNSQGWLPADTIGWWPAMLLPTEDKTVAKDLIDRGIAADFGKPHGILYLVRTDDAKRNVRAARYADIETTMSPKLQVGELRAPVSHAVPDAIGYFTGTSRVDELSLIQFRPGALADHLTSTGGVLAGGEQMPAIAWIAQGATATYGTVTEPCNLLEKFPDIEVLFRHYLQGETALEAYWKSVATPGQGLFIGDPLARPFGDPTTK
jgi:uncharacterized protein (TIGR03790 family)